MLHWNVLHWNILLWNVLHCCTLHYTEMYCCPLQWEKGLSSDAIMASHCQAGTGVPWVDFHPWEFVETCFLSSCRLKKDQHVCKTGTRIKCRKLWYNNLKKSSFVLNHIFTHEPHWQNYIYSACDTKFCHRDFVLKYVVIGEKKDFQVESGLFRDLFWSRSGLFIAICTKIQNCLK